MRLKIVALLAALAALWGFAAFVTVREGLNVLFVETVAQEVGLPGNLVVGALQQERRVTVVAISGDETADAQLTAVRAGTDEALAAWREHTASQSLRLAASDELVERISEADDAFAAITELRLEIDAGAADQSEALAGYTAMINAGFAVYTALGSIDDQEIARQSRTLVTLSRARELLSQEDALVAGALARGEFRAGQLDELKQLVGTQRFLYDSVAAELSPEQRQLYQAAIGAPPVTQLRDVEDVLLAETEPGESPPVTAVEWDGTVGPAMGTILEMEIAAAGLTLERADTARTWVIVRLVLAGGLGLIAVLAAFVISITTARSLIRQLERLRDAARDLAGNRLPRVVERLSAGETVDVASEAPPLRFGTDEIGQVGQAFNAVQETAVRAAVQQAELRHGIRDVFLSLARRTQNLVHKQLSVLDGMERRETDADEMEEIYRVDHLATRMRRNAENLIVLSGASPGRTWRRPVAMIDVVRGAVAEVEDYTRVGLLPVESGALEGRAVGDVIHLLAELIENAASYSPPYAKVGVGGQRVAHGFAIEIEDRGLGMSDAELSAANDKLANPPDFSLADASRLGHYVVAKLAQRHGVRVHLRTSPYGGIVAIVLIPSAILADGAGAGSGGAPPQLPPGPGPDGPIGATPVGSDGATTPAMPPERALDQPPAFPIVRQRQATLAPPLLAPGAAGGYPASRPSGPGHEPRHRLDPPPLAGPGPAGPGLAAPGSAAPAPAEPGIETPGLPGSGMPGIQTPGAEPPGAGPTDAVGAGPVSPAIGSVPPPPGTGLTDPTGGAAGERRTPSGLPWRVRQASLPKQLADDGDVADEAATARDPEQVRLMMRSYQHGTQRGRTAGGSGPIAGSRPPLPGNHYPVDAARTSPELPADPQEG